MTSASASYSICQIFRRQSDARRRHADWFATPNFRGCAFVNASVELAERVTECGVADPPFVARQIVQLVEGAITTAMHEYDPTAADVARASAAQVLSASTEAPQSPG